MKTLLFTYKFLFVTLLSLPLALCSDNDSDETEDLSFEPIEINLENTNLDRLDTSFTVDGFNFKSEYAENTPDGIINGIGIAPGSIELNLSSIDGISKISISIFNNCSACLDIQALNSNEVVYEIKGTELESGMNLVEMEINTAIDSLRIWSGEAIVIWIKLE